MAENINIYIQSNVIEDTNAEFNKIMEKGLKQAKEDDSVSVEDAFKSLRAGI